jgi:hypothetical protein
MAVVLAFCTFNRLITGCNSIPGEKYNIKNKHTFFSVFAHMFNCVSIYEKNPSHLLNKRKTSDLSQVAPIIYDCDVGVVVDHVVACGYIQIKINGL